MPERFRVKLMPAVSADLTEIFEYIERDSPQNAVSVLRGLFDAIDSLEQLPHRCKIHRSSKDAQRVVRSMPVPPFVIYYRIVERHHVVEVLTVRHGARRQPRRFK